jgi:hypothetical protein
VRCAYCQESGASCFPHFFESRLKKLDETSYFNIQKMGNTKSP